jgi:hypothetical protein
MHMINVQISLPDELARDADAAGLLASDKMAALLRAQLSQQRLNALQAARAQLAAEPLPPMSQGEIAAEIDAYRSEKRHADRH